MSAFVHALRGSVLKSAVGLAVGISLWLMSGTALAASTEVSILYLKQRIERPPALSNRQPPPENAGLAGAELAIADSNSTGRFTGHHYSLTSKTVNNGDDALAQIDQWLNSGSQLLVLDLPSDTLERVVKESPLTQRGMAINATNLDDRWRVADCATGLLHTAPSRAMLADGLGQFLIKRRWREWFVLSGSQKEDRSWAAAFGRTAQRYGAERVAEKTWSFQTDLRRTAQAELPLFTQARRYDVVLVADEIGDVGEYVPFNTWLPRPVAGTQGMVPTTWSPVIEQWGAIQLQNRFQSMHQRGMSMADYGGWLAVRAMAEATIRTESPDAKSLYDYAVSDEFELAGFKGQSLTFRDWNGQLRQPVTLVHPRAVVSQSPQEGFLHPSTDLDTLGYDRPEVSCNFKDLR